ncbi:thioredoxin family protein [Ruixingdingia sedimenti]
MFEQPGCIYCARWNAEIAPEYPLTDEGRAAPLRRLQLRAPLPEGLTLDRPATFTPTFVLVADGAETGRIEGYPGEDFFWPLLSALIREAEPPPD